MKKIISLIVVALLLSVFCIAQTNERKDYTVWNLDDNLNPKMIFSSANVRSGAGTNYPVIDSLRMGDTITVRSKTDKLLTLKNIVAPWVEIQYKKEGIQRQGYLWSGLMAMGFATDRNATYMFGIDRIIADEDLRTEYYAGNVFDIALKVIKNGALLTQKNWDVADDESMMYVELKLLGDTKLEGVKQVARIMTSGEACGIPTNYYYAGYTGTDLLDLPSKTSVGDADAYWRVETILFPSEKGGKEGKLIRITEESTMIKEGSATTEPKYKTTYKTESYVWNGKKAIKE